MSGAQEKDTTKAAGNPRHVAECVENSASKSMNTGIGDAINLGWKLAQVVPGRAHSSLLDAYEFERIGFARSSIGSANQ